MRHMKGSGCWSLHRFCVFGEAGEMQRASQGNARKKSSTKMRGRRVRVLSPGSSASGMSAIGGQLMLMKE
jgi:hypothetical protein